MAVKITYITTSIGVIINIQPLMEYKKNFTEKDEVMLSEVYKKTQLYNLPQHL